ncbi:maleylpyruvate isomerase family mycothiol-dependent enzyme [Nocardioides sp. cx-173]|uniref:maleylpyruvate isomerase family mycothiol-dependent enzyme n=1 Tax=Nocardioides sp. cx-173 TaxID=2898796 RepID=UPI001E5063FB|nr:maleylpyruvate isomerase family mycothiol-dependent enzyme [Nocardioides sp. cx-173]MCD4525895.1 maleylpyruvate isomerase family mycothiol-dependent enzyme [Nocardioides sp. cx-173]UGB40046.1 maleylpyruvate isomerase family mycothiol-dependent enzyme [Nocardioides sp. cx-173]
MTTPDATDELVVATQRLVRSVDALRDEQYGAPSLLPDWSRGHVVAHLALNAEGLAGVLTGVVTGEPRTTYASEASRDADIERLAAASPSALRERLFASTSELAEAIAAVPDGAWDTVLERTPGGTTFPAGAVPGMRLREVEVHHADLDAGYTAADWPPRFTVRLLRSMARRTPSAEPFTADPHDLDGTWQCGAVTEGSPVVRGSAADLAWWLAGRGDGAALTTDGGALPRIEAW